MFAPARGTHMECEGPQRTEIERSVYRKQGSVNRYNHCQGTIVYLRTWLSSAGERLSYGNSDHRQKVKESVKNGAH